MARLVESAAGHFLGLRKRLGSSPLWRRVGNASYFSSFDMQEKMLADSRRIESYRQAITRFVKEGDVVLDLGTGTGILAFLAHRQKPSKIYAIDHSSFLRHAKMVARENQLQGIEFVQTHSRSFKATDHVDVIIQEQMGSWVFNEEMVDSVLDLRDRVLREGGRILPNRFEVFLEPAQLNKESTIPFIWENRGHGIDFSCLKKESTNRTAPFLMVQPHDVHGLLASPTPVVSFDLESLISAASIPRHWQYTKKATQSGLLNGFVLFFRAFFGGDVILDTTPAPPHECIAQRRLPFYRSVTTPVAAGDEITVDLRAKDLANPSSWSWSYSTA